MARLSAPSNLKSPGPIPLWVAAGAGAEDLVRHLLDLGADPNTGVLPGAPAVEGSYPWPPLLSAVASEQVETTACLLAAGADPNGRGGPTNTTALHRTALVGNAPLARLLLAAGADANAVDDQGRTALAVAAMHVSPDPSVVPTEQDWALLRVLLEFGADPDHRDHDGATPDQCAADARTRAWLRAVREQKTLRAATVPTPAGPVRRM